jgi:energy-coupling factor transporter ATP-binding protein EcfA2
MPRIISQPAANRAARENFRKTVANPVPLNRVERHLPEGVRDRLRERSPEGELYLWGVRPGSTRHKQERWESISEGDVALFAWKGEYRACARVTGTARNPELARDLWGSDEEGRTWEFIYFLDDPRRCSIPYDQFNEAAGYAPNNVPQGFTVLDEEKSERILDQLDLRVTSGSDDGWPTTWWVNQGSTYDRHRELGIVWAPQTGKGGRVFEHHRNVAELSPGDRVLHYADKEVRAVGVVSGEPATTETSPDDGRDRWNEEGYRAEVDYHPLDEPVPRDDIPLEWRQEKGAPFTSAGELQQGYLYPLSEGFVRKVAGRFPQIGEHFPSVEGGGDGNGVAPRPDLAAVVSDFATKLRDAHLTFGDGGRHEAFVRDFVVSLATKQLVILTGLSGSGKTQIALQFGRWLSGGDDERYRVVPVRPDWTGAEALFGYEDALREPSEDGRRAWHVPGPLEFMLRAARDPDHPYLMVLDEMNLAHVERYFADVISGMESGEPCLPNLREEEDGVWRRVPGADPKLPFPDNLFVAGTVNVDETTYMFSPKVLDRANTLEFRVETDDLKADLRKPEDCPPGGPALVRGFLEVATDEDRHLDDPPPEQQRFVRRVKDLHRELDEGFSFGHRVLYEALRFAALHREAGGDSMEEALDLQVLQKVLPRVHGSRRRVEPVLRTLGRFCWDLQAGGGGDGAADGFDPADPPPPEADEPVLERSFDKVRRMTERLRTNQFVSFTE